jgi:hypothetical protein
MPHRFVRTVAGQEEIRSPARKLPRPMRNLLLIVSPAHPGRHWLGLVNGCGQADLDHLVAHGLLARAEAPEPAASAVHSAGSDADWLALQERVRRTAYGPLYSALNACGKDWLGLMRGYRFSLEVERCADAAALQDLALRFIAQIRADHGPDALHRLRVMLPGD